MISRLGLTKVNLITIFRRDTAYFAENWSNVISTVIFTLVQIALVELLFGNVTTIAGFIKNDIYFLLLIGQIAFYLQVNITFTPATVFAEDVNRGTLDFILTRPIPHQWHIFTKEISVLQMLRDSLPPLVPVVLIIDWSALSITALTLLAGVMIFLAGFIIDHILIYCLALTSFWSGSSTYILNYFWAERSETKLPFEALSAWFRVAAFSIFPVLILTSLSASVMLGFSQWQLWLPLSVIVASMALLFWRYMWSKAIRQYSSASS